MKRGMNTIDKACKPYEDKSPHQMLKELLRLSEVKLDLVWRFETGEEITSLCIADYIKHCEQKKQIIVGSKDSCVYSLSINKELLWKFSAKDEILSVCTSDLTRDNSEEIIIGSKDHYIYILDPEGRLLRKYKCEGPVKAVTAVKNQADNLIVAGSSNGYIYFLGFRGGLHWKYYCGENCRVNGLCVTFLGENERDNVIAVTSKGDVIILDYQGKKLLRRFKKPGSVYAVIAQDIDNDEANEIIVCSDSRYVYALNSYGREKWRFKTKDSVYSISCCDIDMDNRIEVIIGTKDDYVYILDAEGNYEWKYKTDHNVWSIYSAPMSHPKSFDLFAGLSNRMVYYYKLRDWRRSSIKIEQVYNMLLNTREEEWQVLEDLSKDEDEYLRKFSVQKMAGLTSDPALTKRIFNCLRNMLPDPVPVIRSKVVKSLVGLSEYNPNLVIKILLKETLEQDETVRNTIIEGLASIALKIPDKRGDVFNYLQILNQQWEQVDRKTVVNLFDIAQNEFITGNLNKASIDFQLLADRGVDLISRYKSDGFVCSLACADMGQSNGSVMVQASRDNHLHVFDHRGKLKWDKFTETYTQRIFIEDVDQNGQPEIVVGGADGTFQFFSDSGEEKGRILFNDQVNDFYLVKDINGEVNGLVIGSPDGIIYYLDLSGKEQWRFLTKVCVLSVYAEDIDHDGYPEIAIGTLHGGLFLLDKKGNLLWEKNFQSDIRAINSLWQEDTIDLIIGTRNGEIYAIDGQGKIEWKRSCGQVINKISISQIKDQKKILVATQDASLLILDPKGNKTGEIETSGSITALVCADINRDGQKEIIFGSQDDHVYVYQFVDDQKIEAYIKRCKELSGISEKRLSFPRRDILKLIKVNFESSDMKEKVALVGYLGSGKTNLLSQINSGILGEGYIPVYINLQYTKSASLGDFLWEVTEKISKSLSRKGIHTLHPLKSEFTENYLQAFDSFLKSFSSLLKEKKLLILLDDFDRLQSEVTRGNISYEVFRIFEEMINKKTCYFIITVSTYDFNLERKGGYIFLSNALIKDVNFVDRFDVQQELFRQLGDNLKDKKDVVNKILDITGGHAYYLQNTFNIILTYLQRTKKNRLTKKDWSELYTMISDTIDIGLHNPWDTFLPWERVVLSSLARLNPSGATISDIKENLGIFNPLISSSHLDIILKNLTKKSILNEIFTDKDIRYNFAISIFRDWIKDKTNPFQVISKNAGAILQGISLHLFSRQHKSFKDRKQKNLFLQTIGLEFKQWKVLATLSQKWSKLTDRKGEFNKTALDDFVRYFAKVLGFSVKEVLEYPKISCFRFETPTIRLKKIAGMILVVPHTRKPDETDFQSIIGTIANLEAAPNAFMILELEESKVFEKLLSNSKLDLVPLNQERLKSIFLETNYLHALINDVILRYVDFVDLSPYETMGPVESMFFGRLEEIKTMRQLSHKSFAIVGARQLGKTSLMLKVRNLISHDTRIKTLYLDCSTYYDQLTLCQAIIDRIDLGNNAKNVKIDSLGQFKKMIQELCKKEGLKAALFLDEIDALLAIDKDQNELLFKTFRSLSQENVISLIVAGYEELFIRTKDIKSPLFNYLELIRLSSLEKRAATQLITEPMKELGIRLQDEKALVEKICQITSCFPNLIQYLCKRLIQLIASQRRRMIYLTDLTQVSEDPDFQDYLISRFFSNLSPLDKAIVLLLAGSQEVSISLIDKKLRQNNTHLSHKELSEEIDKLIIASVFSKTIQGMRFTLPYFSNVLSENMEKELLLKQLLREVHNERDNSF